MKKVYKKYKWDYSTRKDSWTRAHNESLKKAIEETAKKIFEEFEEMIYKNPMDRLYFCSMRWKYEKLKEKWIK